LGNEPKKKNGGLTNKEGWNIKSLQSRRRRKCVKKAAKPHKPELLFEDRLETESK